MCVSVRGLILKHNLTVFIYFGSYKPQIFISILNFILNFRADFKCHCEKMCLLCRSVGLVKHKDWKRNDMEPDCVRQTSTCFISLYNH